jgi:hypothetical protein
MHQMRKWYSGQKVGNPKKKKCEHLWLIINLLFYVPSRIFHLYSDITTGGAERQQNLGLCSVLRAFDEGGVFIVPHQLRYGASVFLVSSEWPPRLVASYDTQPILTWILTCHFQFKSASCRSVLHYEYIQS